MDIQREINDYLKSKLVNLSNDLTRELAPIVEKAAEDKANRYRVISFDKVNAINIFSIVYQRLSRMTLDMANVPTMVGIDKVKDSFIFRYAYVDRSGKFKVASADANEVLLPTGKFEEKYPPKTNIDVTCNDEIYRILNLK